MPRVTIGSDNYTLIDNFIQVGSNETLLWNTDIQIAYNGTEHRSAKRFYPRHEFTYQIPFQSDRKRSIENSIYGSMETDHLVPHFINSYATNGTVASNATTISFTGVNPRSLGFYTNGFAYIYNNTSYSIVTVSNVSHNTLTFTGHSTSITSANVCPLHVCYLKDSPVFSYGSTTANLRATYVSKDSNIPSEFGGGNPSTFLSNDVYSISNYIPTESIDKSFSKKIDTINNEISNNVYTVSGYTNTRISYIHRTVIRDRQELLNFLNFLYRRQGRFRSFWLPSFQDDIDIVNTGTITTTLTIRNDSYTDFSNRTHIGLLIQGTWNFITVSNIASSGSLVNLTIPNINTNVNNIEIASFLGLYRLDTDRVELNYLGNNVITCSLNIVELQP